MQVVMVDDARLVAMIERLESMGSRGRSIKDGLGLFLGDGMPHAGCDLRSEELRSVLTEALAQRRLGKSSA